MSFYNQALMHEITRTINACKQIIASGGRGVLVTVLSTKGSTYRDRKSVV